MKRFILISCFFILITTQLFPQPKSMGRTLTLSLSDVPATQLISIIADTFGLSIVPSKNIIGKLSINLTNSSLEQSLDAITIPNQWKWIRDNNTIVIMTKKEFDENHTLDMEMAPLSSGVTQDRKHIERYSHDPIALRAINPTFDEFPDSSLIDFSYLLDAPAGKYGQVTVQNDGHFHFTNNNKRIRFFGVTIAASNVDIPKDRIKEVVDVLAHSGCNLLRLHELDNRGGEQYNLVRRNIIDESFPNNKDSQHFDSEYRDRVDYWVKCANEKGIYVYLVVRGYRTFREGDDVPNADKLGRAAKPYAFFDQHLIDLQKKYADEWLIQHINPYTGIPNGKNPGVAMIEIENEDSLFFSAEKWTTLEEPYRTELQDLWNDFLFMKYRTDDALKKAWTNEKGECALAKGESLEKKNISLPTMPERSLDQIRTASGADSKSAPLKCNDGARFAVQIQRKYFKEMRDFLHSKGCTLPMTAVVDSQVIPDTYSVAQELDFVGENAYLDHPSFQAGKEWVGLPFYSNKNYIKSSDKWSLAPYMAQYKWAGKPLVVREWATCWPNQYRVTSMLDIAAYSAMQDYDALIHFSYYTWGNTNYNEPFGLQADPTRWGIFGYAAKLFIEGKMGDFAPDYVNYSDADIFTWGNYMSDIYSLAWTKKIINEGPGLLVPLYGEGFIIPIPINRSTLIGTDDLLKRHNSYNANSGNIRSTPYTPSGQLYRDTDKGFATINTPTFLCIQGQLEKYQPYEAGKLKVISASTIASIMVASLDDKPIQDSNHFSIKMATVAINRGERLDAVTTGNGAGRFVLMNSGSVPIQTLGKPVEKPTQIFIDGNLILEAFLENGTWELEIDNTHALYRLFSDTPNSKFNIPTAKNTGFSMTKYNNEYPPDSPKNIENTFIYPGFAKYIQLIPLQGN